MPPLRHDLELPTLLDHSLRHFESVWCATGTPHAVFEVETAARFIAIGSEKF